MDRERWIYECVCICRAEWSDGEYNKVMVKNTLMFLDAKSLYKSPFIAFIHNVLSKIPLFTKVIISLKM